MMCLAEALLRIPDAHTADELIADKLAGPDWSEKLGAVGLVLRQRRDLLAAADRQGARRRAGPLRQLEGRARPRRRPPRRAGGPHRGARGDEDPRPQFRLRPHHRRGAEARRARARAGPEPQLRHARRGGARPSTDAERYAEAYRGALDRIAKEAKGGFRKSPGISVKLTALHPRYEWSHAEEAKAAILPVVRELALKASKADVHFTIDAEEADRLELQMDMFEALLADDALFANGWGGLRDRDPGLSEARRAACATGSSRLARAHRPQADGPAGQGRLLGHRDQGRAGRRAARLSGVHPQGRDRRFLSRLRQEAARRERRHLSGLRDPQRQHDRRGQGAGRQARRSSSSACTAWARSCTRSWPSSRSGIGDAPTPVRIYAPVGSHKELLAYLVRRLLENGANFELRQPHRRRAGAARRAGPRSGRRA